MKLASVSFSSLLRREIDASLKVLDILGYQPSLSSFEECLEAALGQRPEIRVAALNDNQSREEVKIARSRYFPVINLTANYDRLPEKPSLWKISETRVGTFRLWPLFRLLLKGIILCTGAQRTSGATPLDEREIER